ncbi:MAG TPA: phosphotransferase [Acidimicrobiales bacterium]|nr:phosphotransferase [Acidimicrobiales bacterium]
MLCTRDGEVLGALPRFTVDTPWWMEVAPVVTAARDRYDVDVTVLRILETEERWPPHGGAVSYLAEIDEPPSGLEVATVAVEDHPSRARWARPGGVAELVAWADQFVDRTGPPQQLRTWNLSLVARLPTSNRPVWLKAVPPFMAHEGAVIDLVGGIGPSLIARDDGVVLLEHVEGEDQYDAPAGDRATMIRRWVDVQSRWDRAVDHLPDWRVDSFIAQAERFTVQPEVAAMLDELPARFAALAECGVPETLVHGDFHAGNWRGTTLIDWADSGIGHALFDRPAFFSGKGELFEAELCPVWDDAWREAVPGSDPARAAHLVAPIAALRQALIYAIFVENIEPSEHCYHRLDTEEWINRAVALRSRSPL